MIFDPTHSTLHDFLCRVCGGETQVRWMLKVYQDQFEAQYRECSNCNCLQIHNPTWLKEAYGDSAISIKNNYDGGAFRRNYSALLYLLALEEASLFESNPRFLDFGSGTGLLTQMLAGTGHDAWSTDLYIRSPIFAGNRHLDINNFQPYSFDVVTAIEVFEHLNDLINTGEMLNGLLKSSGTLIISTQIYDPATHTSSWSYLAPLGGQHITFLTNKALHILRQKLGFSSLGFFPDKSGFLLIFSHLSEENLLTILAKAHSILSNPEFTVKALTALDFRSDGIVRDEFGILDKL